MITGAVNAAGEAKIPLLLRGSEGRDLEIEALVDTGFTGSLTLPIILVRQLQLEWLCREQGILGDGSLRIFDVYVATVLWLAQSRIVEIQAAETDPLVGMALIRGHVLQIMAVEGGAVTIEPLGRD